MIEAVDETLATWLRRCCPTGTNVSFGAPDDDRRVKPSKGVNLEVFLAEIRRDVQVQASDAVEIRDEEGRVTGRQQPVQWYRYAYQLTAQGATTVDEHRVLGAVLVAAAAEPLLPADCRAGALTDTELPVLVRAASPTADRSPDSAPQPRPTSTILDLLLTAPLVPAPPVAVAPLVTNVAVGAAKHPTEPAATDDRPRRRRAPDATAPKPSFRSTHTLTEYPVRPAPAPRHRKTGSK